MNGDRNLLLGVLAQQMDFIGPKTLVDGLHGWMRDKSKPLGELLRDRGCLTPAQLQALDLLVEQHVLAHQGDPQRSLAAVPTSNGLKAALKSLREPGFEPALASLGARAEDTDPEATAAEPAKRSPGSMRYQILRPHARGGIGEVFVALDEELNREVALKEMQPLHADVARLRDRFVLEAEITGGLEHPGIVPVYGLGAYPNGRPYYAMRFIQGENLKEAIARFHASTGTSGQGDKGTRGTGAEFRALLRRFIDVCNAVAYAHSRGVIHRDLKPANVMLGQFGETLVVDWGLAKSHSKTRGSDETPLARDLLRPASGSGIEPTQLGSAVGTPAYMSPEQAAGQVDQLGPATDIYSLGATLFTILTNRPPVEGAHIAEVLRRVQAGDVGFGAGGVSPLRAPANSLRGLTPPAQTAPPPLIAITRKAMSLRPEDRYASALEIARDVESFLADEPVSAWVEPWSVRTRRWARKHRTLVTSGAAVLLVLLLALAGGLILVAGYNRQLELTNSQLAQANEELQERRRVAEQNFTLALDAIKSQVFDINNALKHRAGTRNLREKLQKNAMDRLQQLVTKATTPRGEPSEPRGSEAPNAVDHTAFWALINLGDVYNEVDLKPTLAGVEFKKAHEIAQKLAAADPKDARALRDLAISYDRLGTLARQAGTLDQAREYYAQYHKLCQQLATASPVDPVAQRDYAVSLERLGGVLLQAGQPDQARPFYRQYHDLVKQAAAARPADAQAQRDLATAHSRLGEAALRAGELIEARSHFSQYHTISKRLADADPTDKDAQHKLAVAFNQLGDVEVLAGQPAQAWEFYRQSHAVLLQLAAADPADMQAQRDLGVACDRLGDLKIQAGAFTEALAFYQQGLESAKRLVAADPADPDAQHSLAITHDRLGKVALRTGQPTQALEHYQQGLAISKQLASGDPSDLQTQQDLAHSFSKVGDALLALGQPGRALESMTEAFNIRKKLVNAHPNDARSQTVLVLSLYKLGLVDRELGAFRRALERSREGRQIVARLKEAGKLQGKLVDFANYFENDIAECEVLAKLAPALIDDPTWALLWSWPRW